MLEELIIHIAHSDPDHWDESICGIPGYFGELLNYIYKPTGAWVYGKPTCSACILLMFSENLEPLKL